MRLKRTQRPDVRPIRGMIACVVAALMGLCLCLQARADERRLALVIANSSYMKLGRLKNPVNDANLISKALEMRGFEVMTGTNVRATELTTLVNTFLEKARSADVSLFYYAGHAFQVSERNFLAPIDASLHGMEDVQSQTFEVQKILQGLQASGGLHLIFLDACRDNPFEAIGGSMPRTSDGLARIVSSSNLLISYATQPGNVARDGDGSNSPFARAIAEHMHSQGEDISTMMIKVRADVIKATGGAQIPWDSSSLTRRFFFNPGAPKVAFLDTEVWQFARSLEEPDVLQAYIDRYPSAPHVDEARAELRRLTVASISDDSSSRQAKISRLSEDSLWQLAERTRIRAIAQTYIKRYPSGKYTETALSYLHSSTFDETVGEQCERAATHPRDATTMFDGVPLEVLAQNVDAAIDTCERAVRENPGFAKYKALLARAYSIKNKARAIELYQQAAAEGNLRAMVSLALLKEAGDGLPKDVPAALRLYETAADRGSADGAINLAVALMEGSGVAKNTQRAVALLKQAVDWGSGIAAYNLGAIAANCPATTGKQAKGECGQLSGQSAASFFDQAVRLGFRRGFLALAILYDEGRGVARDPNRAADLLYQGASQDTGEIVGEFGASKPRPWNRETVLNLQKRLSQAQHYQGPLDGKISPGFADSLKNLRTYGG
jgi:uncharacterized caspase-like protein